MWLLNRKPIQIKNISEHAVYTIKGEIQQCKDLIIPGINIKCVYYSSLVESFTYGPMRKSRRMWFPRNYTEKIETFFIDDGTGRIVVFPEIKDMYMYNVPYKEIYMNALRYKIYFLKPGDRIKIRGIIGRNESAHHAQFSLSAPVNKKIMLLYINNKHG